CLPGLTTKPTWVCTWAAFVSIMPRALLTPMPFPAFPARRASFHDTTTTARASLRHICAQRNQLTPQAASHIPAGNIRFQHNLLSTYPPRPTSHLRHGTLLLLARLPPGPGVQSPLTRHLVAG